jgi:serine/threonine protein kinase
MGGELSEVSAGNMRKSAFKELLIRAVQRDNSALAQLAAESALTTANISHVLLGLAGDPISFEMGYGCRPEDFFREIGAMYADLGKATGHERLRGFLGFLRFTMVGLRVAARPTSQEAPARAIGEMQDLLADSQVREVFHALYKPSGQPEAASYWKDLDLDSLEVHRVGTTSVILKCRVDSLGGEARALKCLLFPYSQIQGIASATRRYATDYPSGQVPCTVHIYASTDKWILMDFAAGLTLAEFLSRERRRADAGTGRAGGTPGLDGSSVAAIRTDLLASLGPQLLDAAQQLHAAGFEHRDLTPSNIIVMTKPDIHQPNGKVQRGAVERLVLIDLGRNYLFTRQADVGENREARFVAPEVKDDKPAASSDIYSLGMILVEVTDPEGSLDGVIPDSLYRYAPYMARFVEDLIDASPDNRLLIFGQGIGPDLYDGLRAIFADLLKILAADKPALIKPGRVRQFLELFLPSSRQVGHRLRLWRETRSAHPAIEYYSGYLLGWSVACTAAWYVIFTVVVLWGLHDVGVDATPTAITVAERFTRSGSWLPAVPDWRFSLQSALLGFSIGMAGARFYQNFFAGLTARRLAGRRAFWTEVFLRGASFCGLPPILFGNIVEPRWWPWLCAIGFVWPTATSFLSYSQARHCLKRARGLSTVSASLDPSLEGFGQWWTSMAFMISGIVIIATCLQLGWAHDYWIYAVWFCLINVVQMYAIKCAYFAPAARGALTRAFIAGERWQEFQRTRNGPALP